MYRKESDKMKTFTSFMKDDIHDFISYRKLCNCWCDSYESNLKHFEDYCIKNFPNAKKLSQQMVDEWCKKRKTEKNRSRDTRIFPVIVFLKYTNKRNITNLKIPELLKREKNTYIPHIFTKEELKNFFYVCDNYLEYSENITIKVKIKAFTLPAYFRLLYSSGMRPVEIRLLRVEDVDLKTGIINIRKSKGHIQHYVVVDDLVKEYLIKYDKQISLIFPNRTYFFSSKADKPYCDVWHIKAFEKCWYVYNNSHARPYDFRHSYAIKNVNKHLNEGVEFITNLNYLSKSMGHLYLESTKRYYTLVPQLSEIFKTQVETNFDDIIPEMKDYE